MAHAVRLIHSHSRRRDAMKESRELAECNADLAWWEAIFSPLGYRIYGWTYRNHASVISPTGKYVEVDGKILELIAEARKAGV